VESVASGSIGGIKADENDENNATIKRYDRG